MIDDVNVELLIVPDCPHDEPTVELLHGMLEKLGLPPTTLRVRVIASREDADQYRFIGSPTVLVDGVDPFPRPDHAPAFACRLYRSPSGASGRPDPELLWTALSQASAHGHESTTHG